MDGASWQADEADAQVIETERLAKSAQQAIAEIRSEASIEGGGGVIAVDAGGRLLSLELTDRALRRGPRDLARAISSAYDAAVETSAERVELALSDLNKLPGVPASLAYLQRFSTGKSAKAARTLPRNRDDDDEGQPRSILHRA